MLFSLYEHEARSNNTKFKFESARILEESYENMFNRNWKCHPRLEENLENLKHNITDWKNYTIHNLHHKKKKIMRRLQGIDNALHQGRFHQGLQNLEMELQKELSLILHQEELMWF